MEKKVSEIKVGDIVRFRESQNLMSNELSKFYNKHKSENFIVANVSDSNRLLQLEGDYGDFIHSERFIKLDFGVKKQDDLKEEIKSNNLIMEAQEKEIERLNQIIKTKDEEKERIAKREATTFENYSDSLLKLNKEIGIQKQEIEKLDNQLRNHRLTLQFALNL